MIDFLAKPVFFLTPYIFLWSLLNGLIVMGLIRLLKISASRKMQVMTGVTTAVTSMVWNWSIQFNQSTVHLNVDHPFLRISWADGLNGICVFAMTAGILGFWADPRSPAKMVSKVAGLAAIVTIFTDTFFF
jgi:hypothetical protein